MSATSDSFSGGFRREPFIKTLSIYDWVFALIVVVGTYFAWQTYAANMDSYEVGILFGTGLAVIGVGWFWKPSRTLVLVVSVLSMFALYLYGKGLAPAETNFFLRFLLSSQSAIMWMSALFVMATVTYFIALFSRSTFVGKVASAMAWSGTTMGLVGLMVRWRESYMLGADVGHIPVSNLYEVFILFTIITAMLYLYYERKYNTRALGGFVMLVISASVGFLLWYHFTKDASQIQPLVPALQSYWMKIHVPANFIGYGCFALAAMVGSLSLLMHYYKNPSRLVAILTPVSIFVVVGGYYFLRQYYVQGAMTADIALSSFYAGFGTMLVLGLIGWATLRPTIQASLPSTELIDDVMYKSIALGFAFFTIATVLGAMWAAEAWGGYWSWDPKETWALVVWLNYAAWLHMRLTKGWRGAPMAWWSIIGLFVTLFAFLGVNMFLSGLHSYGEL